MSVYQHPSDMERAIDALRKDLLVEAGPQISTVRNYNFAILPYAPELEFKLRQKINALCVELRDSGWNTGSIALHSLLLERLRAQGQDFLDSSIALEKRLANNPDRSRSLKALADRIIPIIEGDNGLAQNVVLAIEAVLAREAMSRTVVFLGRAGALYPFFRTSSLLKHIAGKTRDVPVVLLYPGKVVGDGGLSFMGQLDPDRDYRPRIYR